MSEAMISTMTNDNIPSSASTVVDHDDDDEILSGCPPPPPPPPLPSDNDDRGDDYSGEIEIDYDYHDDDDNRRRPGKRRRNRFDAGSTAVVGPAPPPPLTVDDVSSMDASTYLAHVDRQARSLPDVFVAPIRPPLAAAAVAAAAGAATAATSPNDDGDVVDVHERGSLSTMRVFLSGRFDILPPPSTRHLPPGVASGVGVGDDDGSRIRAWVGGTISNFSNLRSYLEAESSRLCGGGARSGRGRRSRPEKREYAVPRMRDRPRWHAFCLGREQAYGNVRGYDDNDDDDEEEEEEAAEGDATYIGEDGEGGDGAETVPSPVADAVAGHPPSTSLLLQLDQVLVRAVFHHHVHYLVEWKMTLSRDRATWLYALLARMEKPLHREECVGVREVLRECCRRRWELELPAGEGGGDDDDSKRAREQLALLNTLIAIAGVYFEQGARSASGPGGGDCLDSLFSCRN
jgi:hypothetical protein